jgi:hypothetical protein
VCVPSINWCIDVGLRSVDAFDSSPDCTIHIVFYVDSYQVGAWSGWRLFFVFYRYTFKTKVRSIKKKTIESKASTDLSPTSMHQLMEGTHTDDYNLNFNFNLYYIF